MEKFECDFCGKSYADYELASTSFGVYCLHCLNIMIHEANRGIKELSEFDLDLEDLFDDDWEVD